MGSTWKFCWSCDGSIGAPTLRDLGVGSVTCDHCGRETELDRYEKEDLAEELAERLDKLEAAVKRLQDRGWP